MSRRAYSGFTIVEILIVIAVIAILAVISVVGYDGVQRRASTAVVAKTTTDGLDLLMLYDVPGKTYPSNFADTSYAQSTSVALALYTNAATAPVYQSLTASQNAQLFLNSCNGFMPIVSGGTTYNTSCSFSGINLHSQGKAGSNVVINGPSISQSNFVLTCGSACTTAQSNIIAAFTAQGGTFPIVSSSGTSSLPAPVTQSTGKATKFCLEGRSIKYDDIIYHASNDTESVVTGACPSDPELHYP